MYFKKLSIAAALSLSFVGMGAAQASNLVTNGTFNTLSGWTVTQLTTGDIYASNNAAVFDGSTTGEFITQTLSGLTIGDTYQFTFQVNVSNDAPASFAAYFGSSTLLPAVNGAGTGQYVTYTETATATAASEVLKFQGYNSNGMTKLTNVNGIDLTSAGNVKAVPEPEVLGMMMAGLAVMGLVTRRKQSASLA
ncbi:PEP-CTERM sorting domain-containing protein [Methylomonas sp. AM2-LC]|uniref:PEP-CTERM sorting domain-containing protein n=1 Tax=Methylomonas sp. AM2-LC TaxID=3153301 RepID=UPI003264F570